MPRREDSPEFRGRAITWIEWEHVLQNRFQVAPALDSVTRLRLLKEARNRAGITQVNAAKALGWTQSFISKVERGEIRIDPIELQRFAELYGVEVVALLPRKKT